MSRPPARSRLSKFRADRRGGVAIEFAIVSIPFFLIVFAILETALVFFMGQLFDTAVNDAARAIRTNNQAPTSLDSFRASVCEGTLGLFDCDEIYLRVNVFTSYADIDFAPPIGESGNFTDSGGFTPSNAEQIVAVTAYYQWPVILDFFGNSLADLGNGHRLLAGSVALKTEPYDPQ